MNVNIERSKERVYEKDGNTYKVVREFETSGTSILEHVISMLIDKMNDSENEVSKKKEYEMEM